MLPNSGFCWRHNRGSQQIDGTRLPGCARHIQKTMTSPNPTPDLESNTVSPGLRWFLTALLAAIGLAVLVVVSYIAYNGLRNKSLIPVPENVRVYDCKYQDKPFTLKYLHGSSRVEIRSAQGLAEGTVSNNVIDWGAFAGDATLLGFLPPGKILFEGKDRLELAGEKETPISCTPKATPPAAVAKP